MKSPRKKAREKVSLQNTLDQLIDAFMVDISEQKRKYKKVNEFRVSSMPFCPIRALLYEDRTDSYSMDFYTSIGTAVHETIQKWATVGSFANNIFAVWKAAETGELFGPCLKSELPKEWDNYTIQFEEVTISYNGLSGHVDLILQILPGQYVVIDFKTTDLSGKQRRSGNWQNEYPASRSSIIQIGSYCTLLSKIHKLNIVAWCLIYVDRGKVISGKRDYHKVLRPWTKSKQKRMLGFIDEACDNNKLLKNLQKIIAKSDEFSPKAVKVLKSIVINRPCTDEAKYKAWMDYKFWKGYSKNPDQGTKDGDCFHKGACLKGSKSAYKSVVSKL